MTILAFLQNPWFFPNTPQVIIDRYANDDDYRRIVLSQSATGRRLSKCLGEDLFNMIIWENANPKHGERANANFAPDLDHIQSVISKHNPDIIIAFGKRAESGVRRIHGNDFIRSNHPAARGVTNTKLIRLENLVRKRINENKERSHSNRH